MTALLLSPHNDDESLFAAFTCLRERPHVIVVLRSMVQEQRGGPTAAVREAETDAAMSILGCSWEQWLFGDDVPDFATQIPSRINALRSQFDHCYAPEVELEDGNDQHNLVGAMAASIFGPERVSGYLTYTKAGKSDWGRRVEYEPEWVPLKLAALACYRSQAGLANCSEHFLRGQHEYLA